MPICLPETPYFNASNGERKVWQALVDQLPSNAYILHGYKLTDHNGDHEIDFVVVWPGVGIIVIEVKGGRIDLHADGTWTTTNRERRVEPINPVKQGKENMYALKQYVEAHWSQGTARMMWLAAFPDTDFDAAMHTHELPRNRIIDKTELASIADILRREGKAANLQQHASSADCDAFLRAVRDIRDPEKRFIEDAYKRKALVKELSQDQARLLSNMEDNRNLLILGPAGSGKTFLALEKARQLGEANKRVALICYSQGLAQLLKRQTEQWPEAERPAYVGTFHALATFWAVRIKASEEDEDFWTQQYGAELCKHLLDNPRLARFDAIVVDEAQDFHNNWWDVLNLSYGVDIDESIMYVFGDSDQSLADRSGYAHLPLPKFRLNENLRSTRPIGETAAVLATHATKPSPIDGPNIRFVECAVEDAHDCAEEMAEAMQEEGWRPSDIAVVTTNHRHRGQRKLIAEYGKGAPYWARFWSDEVFYAHISGFKGLERPVVIVAVDGWKAEDKARNVLYTAISRPRDVLIVCGNLDEIRADCGDAIADVLEAHSL